MRPHTCLFLTASWHTHWPSLSLTWAQIHEVFFFCLPSRTDASPPLALLSAPAPASGPPPGAAAATAAAAGPAPAPASAISMSTSSLVAMLAHFAREPRELCHSSQH